MKLYIAQTLMISTLSCFSLATHASPWQLDNTNSKITFVTQGSGGTTAKFSQVSGQANFEPEQLQNMKINLDINVSSLSAGIKTPLYKGSKGLNADKYPKLSFQSTKITPINNDTFRMEGLLTMHGVTKSTVWNLNIDRKTSNEHQLNMNASTKIDRTLWGMTDFRSLINDSITLNAKTRFIKSH